MTYCNVGFQRVLTVFNFATMYASQRDILMAFLMDFECVVILEPFSTNVTLHAVQVFVHVSPDMLCECIRARAYFGADFTHKFLSFL